jgi:hypothetical protein
MWSPYTDSGLVQANSQPSRTRAIALQISLLCEISNDLLVSFYHPNSLDKPLSKQAELKKLSELHTRLEAWRKNLPKEMEPKEGQLPNVLLMQYVLRKALVALLLTFVQYVFSAALYAPVSPLPQIYTHNFPPSCSCFAKKVMHTSCRYGIKITASL